jgi:hypothetical protein
MLLAVLAGALLAFSFSLTTRTSVLRERGGLDAMAGVRVQRGP